MIVFSFTLFGSLDKYCKGMLRNVEEIHKRFPEAFIWVYVGNDVPESIMNALYNAKRVKIILTNATGLVNKIFRYLPIDDPEVDVCIVRDSDSRVLDRDETSIHDFLASSKLTQIIRDHRVHTVVILGGMVSFKKGALPFMMRDAMHHYLAVDINTKEFEFEDDQNFLKKYIYPVVVQNALIQDEYDQYFEPPSMHVKISKPRIFPDFIGNVFEYDDQGNEYTVCGP